MLGWLALFLRSSKLSANQPPRFREDSSGAVGSEHTAYISILSEQFVEEGECLHSQGFTWSKVAVSAQDYAPATRQTWNF